jgi:hypothetical protein
MSKSAEMPTSAQVRPVWNRATWAVHQALSALGRSDGLFLALLTGEVSPAEQQAIHRALFAERSARKSAEEALRATVEQHVVQKRLDAAEFARRKAVREAHRLFKV